MTTRTLVQAVWPVLVLLEALGCRPAQAESAADAAQFRRDFHRAEQAVQHCETIYADDKQFARCWRRVFDSLTDGNGYIRGGYIVGFDQASFLRHARRNNIMALIEGQGLNKAIREAPGFGGTLVGYCQTLDIACDELIRFWREMPIRYTWDNTAWVPVGD